MAEREKYYGVALSIGDPTDQPMPVEPNDDEDLPEGVPNYLYVGVAGDLDLVFPKVNDGEPQTITVAQGYHLFRPTRIRAENTTAENIFACYDNEIE